MLIPVGQIIFLVPSVAKIEETRTGKSIRIHTPATQEKRFGFPAFLATQGDRFGFPAFLTTQGARFECAIPPHRMREEGTTGFVGINRDALRAALIELTRL